MERPFLAIVNHTGSCGSYHYQMGKPVVLPESVIRALGANVKILEDMTPKAPEELTKGEPAEEQPSKEQPKQEKKEIKFPVKDKMVKSPGKSK